MVHAIVASKELVGNTECLNRDLRALNAFIFLCSGPWAAYRMIMNYHWKDPRNHLTNLLPSLVSQPSVSIIAGLDKKSVHSECAMALPSSLSITASRQLEEPVPTKRQLTCSTV